MHHLPAKHIAFRRICHHPYSRQRIYQSRKIQTWGTSRTLHRHRKRLSIRTRNVGIFTIGWVSVFLLRGHHKFGFLFRCRTLAGTTVVKLLRIQQRPWGSYLRGGETDSKPVQRRWCFRSDCSVCPVRGCFAMMARSSFASIKSDQVGEAMRKITDTGKDSTWLGLY